MSEEVKIPGRTIIELVQHWGTSPDNDTLAFVSVDRDGRKRQISRREVYDFVRRFAHILRAYGVKKGSIVCNALPNSLERVVCEFGILFSGATSMNGQIFRSDGEDFMDALRTSQCSFVIVDPNVPKGARHILLKEVPLGCESAVQSYNLPNLQRLIICARDDVNAGNDFITSLRRPDLPQYTAEVSPQDLATVMTTSGSTGYSKLVKLSHANICHFGVQMKAIEPLPGGAHFLNCAPLGWAGGYPKWYLSCGVTRYFLDMHDGPFPDLPAAIWRTVVQEKIVYSFLSPMYVSSILMNKALWQGSPWKPKILCLAGQPVKRSTLDIIGKLCEAVDINYGTTECNLVSTHRIVDPSTYIDGCAGSPGYGVQIKIVNSEMEEVPQDTTGEVLIRSPALCSGYLNNESISKDRFTADGWFCTDDAGYASMDGKLHVEGRQSDSILRGAYILYPGWLEQKMRDVPEVKDIAVVAVPNKVLYNEICACVIVSGVEGVVAGSLGECVNEQGSPDECLSAGDVTWNQDDLDNAVSFMSHKSCALFESVDEDSELAKAEIPKFTIHTGINVTFSSPTSETDRSNLLEKIRVQGASKPLSASYNETKAKHNPMKGFKSREAALLSPLGGLEEQGVSCPKPDLTVLERKLRDYTSGLQVLHEKDAMRMVPRYYMFMDKFPMTNTDKINRKELRAIAASALGLDRC